MTEDLLKIKVGHSKLPQPRKALYSLLLCIGKKCTKINLSLNFCCMQSIQVMPLAPVRSIKDTS